MRILLVHNFYRAAMPSGENRVYEAERDLLRAHGHEVHEFTRSNDEFAAAPARIALESALFAPWNPFVVGRFGRMVAQLRPDVVHVHNTFPLISPAILPAAGASGAAVVMTVHNYRQFCAAAVALRQGSPCLLCVEQRSVLPALRYGCYRNSRLATLPVAATIALHRQRGTWERDVDAFICFSAYQRERLVQGGLPAARIHLKPNFSAPPAHRVPWAERDDRVVFVGRIGEEKGVDLLVRAWLDWGVAAPALEIIGSGDQEQPLRRLAESAVADRIRFVGQLAHAEVQKRVANAKLLVLPSRCIEGMPMTVLEAYAHGVPVVATRLGPLPDLVEEGVTGRLFPCGDAGSLAEVLREMWSAPEAMARMSQAAAVRFDALYSPQANYQQLLRIYEQARADAA